MMRLIARRELFQAQVALLVAIALQVVVWKINGELLVGPQYLLIPTEIILVLVLAFTAKRHQAHGLNYAAALVLLGLISIGNAVSLILVVHSLVVGHATVTGMELLVSAIAIVITNIIVFALWYWEIDGPGLSRRHWSKNSKDFQFTQQDREREFEGWRPEFLDYLYLSLTNAINFAAADGRPLTHGAKLLMGSQALVSVLTLALLVARSVSILGT